MSSPEPLNDDQLADALEGKTAGDIITAGKVDPSAIVSARAAGSTLTDQERQSLTIWGEHLSAQVRSYAPLAGDPVQSMVLAHVKRAPRSSEDGRPYVLFGPDMRKLRDLLNEATARGDL